MHLGGAFFGVSSTKTDSQVVGDLDRLRERGFALLEVQYLTTHLAQFGVVEVPHRAYMRQFKLALELECGFGR